MKFRKLLSLCILSGALHGYGQATQAASEGNSRLSAGLGLTSFNMDWGHGRMLGPTLWVDWRFTHPHHYVPGISLEAEARDISWNRGTHPKNFRHDTIAAAGVANWHLLPRLDFYGKGLIGFASIDFTLAPNNPYYATYHHDTRGYFAYSPGFQYRIGHGVSARLEYEYQFWETFTGGTPNPQGFTLGAMYSFGRRSMFGR